MLPLAIAAEHPAAAPGPAAALLGAVAAVPKGLQVAAAAVAAAVAEGLQVVAVTGLVLLLLLLLLVLLLVVPVSQVALVRDSSWCTGRLLQGCRKCGSTLAFKGWTVANGGRRSAWEHARWVTACVGLCL